ncbi:hypothetical protein LguiA_017683 [Lonicera macranthoides]
MAAVIDSSLVFASANVVFQFNKPQSAPYCSSISFTRTLLPPKLVSASPSMKKLSSFTIHCYLTEENTKTGIEPPLKVAEAVKPIPSILEYKEKEKEIQTLSFNQLSAVRKEMNSMITQIPSALKDELDSYEVLKYPLATEAAMKQIIENNTLVFIVDTRANKKNIREAFQNMFKIRAKKVNTLLNCDGTKKAFLMLSPDYNALDVAKKIKFI